MNKFIGSGIIFPIKLNNQGRPDWVNNIDLIKSSIAMIVNWPKYTRFFNENFGARLDELIEEPNDSITRSLARSFLKDALERDEKRIIVSDVIITGYNQEKVMISVKFSIRNSDIEDTFIFPYYKNIT